MATNSFEQVREAIYCKMYGGQWDDALYWCEKLMSLRVTTAEDVVCYCLCLLFSKQYNLLLSYMERNGLVSCHRLFRLWAAKCLLALRRYADVVQLFDGQCTPTAISLPNVRTSDFDGYGDQWKVDSGLLLALGKAHEELNARDQAAEAYRQCLFINPFCAEAFGLLLDHHLLSVKEMCQVVRLIFAQKAVKSRSRSPSPYSNNDVNALGSSSVGSAAASANSCEIAETVYKLKLGQLNESDLTGPLSPLRHGFHFQLITAKRLYSQGKYREALKITNDMLIRDEYRKDCYLLHINLLTSLSMVISWYAVACYYYCTEKYEEAKKFFCKSIGISSHHDFVWIGYGHSFSAANEHDQAMLCYCRAWTMYCLCNNLKLAEKIMLDALALSPDDPYALQEIGVLTFKQGSYEAARDYLNKALEKITAGRSIASLSAVWKPLLNNLGHVYRKLKLYDEAIKFHEDALLLVPDDPSSFTSIGFIFMLKNQFSDAVEWLHRALSLKQDDTLATSLLSRAMDAWGWVLEPATVFQEKQLSLADLRRSMMELRDHPTANSSISDMASDLSIDTCTGHDVIYPPIRCLRFPDAMSDD
ncbi:unnamed protein product [Soboliphyme baturini]|uniref:TPR_REGION domain-containing protein n=1 Tax=Soboliphyme baturini TaxID=241478 RepID=A0A183IPJ2_9BILA|nr:unnamed protein product [Soboliphyme baturini]